MVCVVRQLRCVSPMHSVVRIGVARSTTYVKELLGRKPSDPLLAIRELTDLVNQAHLAMEMSNAPEPHVSRDVDEPCVSCPEFHV